MAGTFARTGRLAVVGGGPAGLFLARMVRLAQPGVAVDVYERNPPGPPAPVSAAALALLGEIFAEQLDGRPLVGTAGPAVPDGSGTGNAATVPLRRGALRPPHRILSDDPADGLPVNPDLVPVGPPHGSEWTGCGDDFVAQARAAARGAAGVLVRPDLRVADWRPADPAATTDGTWAARVHLALISGRIDFAVRTPMTQADLDRAVDAVGVDTVAAGAAGAARAGADPVDLTEATAHAEAVSSTREGSAS
ncbi:hypothetical protein O7608_09610 [Solwaraspora sp. WMMA2056]|uniref:hypothetical protein n=1 Tax=Solwaraspora sp. WMMA2056 TaxID=3015161 RepID=UPI00259B3599|nr:hypothetical protein [Solwaraspora sp. WMMA2056]WJK42599.1 hypothetical protein O7608_09610 [Solwaraspora sp. WMMA2056]